MSSQRKSFERLYSSYKYCMYCSWFVNEFQNVLSTFNFKIAFPIWPYLSLQEQRVVLVQLLGYGVGIPGPFRTSTSPHSVAVPEWGVLVGPRTHI